MSGLQTHWDWLIAIYLFLGGLGAGAFCAVGVISLASGERFKSTVRFGAWASAILVTVGVLVLLLHAGKPFRAMVMFKSFVNFGSWMTIGAWLLLGAILLNGLFALFWTDRVLGWFGKLWRPLNERRRVLQVALAAIGLPVNLGVAVYTGVLLGVLPFRPLWHTWLLPALFTASALDTGVGMVTGYATLKERGEGVSRLRKVLEISIIVLIAIEGTILVLYLRSLLNGTADAALSARLVTGGPLAFLFWVGVVLLGLVVPLLVCVAQLSGLLKRKAATVVPLVGLASCLIGGWTLRFVVLSAGLPMALNSPVLQQIVQGVKYLP